MASVFKKKNSPYWYAAFRDHLDTRVQRSTKQRAHAAAVAIANQWERTATKGRRRTLTEAQARRVIAEIVEDSTGEALHFHSCRAWLDEWTASKRGAVGERSQEKYEQVVTSFLNYLGERADLPLSAISPKDVRGFRDSLATKRRSPATINQTVRKVLTAPFHAAVRLGYIPVNPCAGVEALKDDAEVERGTFSPEQVAQLIDAAEGEWRGVILAGYFTGLRLRDVSELTWEAIDMETGLMKLRTRKTGKVITMPLHRELAAWLAEQPRGIGRAPVFPKLTGKGTGGAHGLSAGFAAIMARAGIKGRLLRGATGRGRRTNSLSFHSLRHSFVSALANAGVAAELRQKLSGHTDDRSHARYTHHEVETLRAAVATLPQIRS